jgi:serine/threonine protein kinase
MGEVYRALDVRTGQKLALKRSRTLERGSAQRRRASLEREYYTLAQLSHPSIIAVYDYGVDDEGPYYTMELLDGADLDGGRLPWREAAAMSRRRSRCCTRAGCCIAT